MYLGISLALLVFCGVLWTKLFRLYDLWDQILGGAIFSLAQVVAVSMTLGRVPGGYKPIPLLAATGVIFVVLLAVTWRKRLLRTPAGQAEGHAYLRPFLTVVGVTLPIWLWLLVNGLLLPPVYWDELYYHLISPAMWVRAGQVHEFATGSPFVAGYPSNFGFLPGWAMVMTGNDVWAELAFFPSVFVGLAAVVGFCRALGVKPWNAFWAGLLFVTTPIVIMHAKSAYIDLPLSAFFCAALYMLYRYGSNDGDERHLALAGAALGILAGAKYSGAYMAIAGLIPLLYRLRMRPLERRAWLRTTLLLIVPAVALGGYWYIRNLVLFGNPVHPMRLEIAGIAPFGGQYRLDAFTFTAPENTWVTLGKAILETGTIPEMDSYYTGFGPQLLLLAIPGLVLFLGRARSFRSVHVWLWLVPAFVVLATLPAKYPRYLIHLSLLLLPFAGWLMDSMARRPAFLVKLVAAGMAVYSTIIGMTVRTVLPGQYDAAARDIWTVNAVGVGAQYFYLIDLNAAMGGPLRIAHGSLRLTYPLLGPHWQNDLIYVEPTSEAAWLEEVLARGPNLFATDASLDSDLEQQWVKRHPEVFHPLFADPVVSVYLVIPGDAAHQRFVQRLGVKP